MGKEKDQQNVGLYRMLSYFRFIISRFIRLLLISQFAVNFNHLDAD